MTERKELFRQSLHILYGPILVVLHYHWFIINELLLVFTFFLWIILYLIKKKIYIPLIYSFLKNTERKSDFKSFPWKWFFYFTLSSLLLFLIFQNSEIWVAYISILILCILDSVSTLIWTKYWKTKWPFNKKKTLEWSVAWFVFSMFWTYYLANSYWISLSFLFITCFIAMLVEVPEFTINWFKLNDNVTIPFVSALVLSFLQFY